MAKVDIAEMLVEEPRKLLDLYEKGEIVANTPAAREALEAAVEAARDEKVVRFIRDLLSHANPAVIVREYAELSPEERRLVDKLAEAGIIRGWSSAKKAIEAILAAASVAPSIAKAAESAAEKLAEKSDVLEALAGLYSAVERGDYRGIIKYVDELLDKMHDVEELAKMGVRIGRDALLRLKAYAEMMLALDMLRDLPRNPDEAYRVAEEARKMLEEAAAYLPVARELYGILYEEPSIETLECIANKYASAGAGG